MDNAFSTDDKPGRPTGGCPAVPNTRKRGHRDDIDGLRAIAVVSVLLYHSGIPGFDGGYVGVDVFFVISGFLITEIIRRELTEGEFTIAKFYERRIRRIFPALFAFLAVVFLIGLAVLVPPDMAQLGKSIFATALFVSNVFFYRQSGYFDATAETKPLLHTWSLAVEEQYYILFPIALVLIHRWRHQWMLGVIIAAALVSFALSIATVEVSRPAAFFLPHSRAWELLLGSALAFAPQCRNAGLAGLGLILITIAVVSYDSGTPFPGFAALAPCLGAAAIIFAANGSWIGRILSNGLLTFVGKISYSLYLWHWPILVYGGFLYGDRLPRSWAVLALILAVALATLSWKYIETPFRRRGPRPRLPLIAAAAAVTGFAALGIVATSGFPGRLPPEAVAMAAAAEEQWPHAPGCFFPQGPNPISLATQCASHSDTRLVIWGDSHAALYAASLDHLVGPGVLLMGRGGCAPLDILQTRSGRKSDFPCAEFNNHVLQAIVNQPQIRTVVLSARWARFLFPASEGESQRLTNVPEERQMAELIASLRRVIGHLHSAGKNVVVIGIEPEFRERLPACLARAVWLGRAPTMCKHHPRTVPGTPLHRALQGLAAEFPAVYLFRPSDIVCGPDGCKRTLDGMPIMRDSDHFTNRAAAYLMREMVTNPEWERVARFRGQNPEKWAN